MKNILSGCTATSEFGGQYIDDHNFDDTIPELKAYENRWKVSFISGFIVHPCLYITFPFPKENN